MSRRHRIRKSPVASATADHSIIELTRRADKIGNQLHTIAYDVKDPTSSDPFTTPVYFYLRTSWPPGLYTVANAYDPKYPQQNGLYTFIESRLWLLEKFLAHDETLTAAFGPLAQQVPPEELPYYLQNTRIFKAFPYSHHEL